MSNNKRIAKNTLFLYVRMLLIMGVSLYTSRILLKALGVDDYGLYSAVGGIVSMFSFMNGSLSAATSRFITVEIGRNDYEKIKNVFSTAVITHIIIALIIIVLSETLGLWFFYNKMIIPEERINAAFWVFQISIISSFFSLTQVPYNALIIANEEMSIYAYVGIAEAVSRLLIAFAIVVSPFDKLVFYAVLLCLLHIIILLYYRYYCNKRYSVCKVQSIKDTSLLKEMLAFAGSDIIGQISVLAQGQGLNLLLNTFFGPAVNAARAIAYQVQGAVTQFSNNFMTAVKPQIIKQYTEGNIKEMLNLLINSSCFSFYLMWMISLPIILKAPYILSLWLGEYPDHTVTFLVLVLILCLIQTIKTPRTTVFHATGHIKLTNIVVGGILCMALPVAYVLLRLGLAPESVFWAAILTMTISEFASVFILKKYLDYSIKNYLLNVHFRCLCVAIISFIATYLMNTLYSEMSFLHLLYTIVISTCSIVVTVLLIGLSKSMKSKVKSVFLKLIHHAK